jgi:hypothetical protein
MAKISKALPSLYGGESEQTDELILDTQCRAMVNCVPDVVTGLERRNGTEYVSKNISGLATKTFHTYDRGEGDEEYIFVKTGNSSDPLQIFTKAGVEKTVSYLVSSSIINTYMTGNLKGLTIQDRTFILNKDKVITQSTNSSPTTDYRDVAYYWIKRVTNDDLTPYRFAVYLNGVSYNYSGYDSDTVATQLASIVNALSNYTAVAIGSVIKITSTIDFTYDTWDSWGNQASFGWKGKVNKLSDLPADMPWDDVIVQVTGDDSDNFTDYYVKSEDGTWRETRDPYDLRGTFNNMPIYVDRKSDGTFEVGELTWNEPTIGNEDNNPTPSFVGNNIQDIFFFKNRLGFASSDSIILSETGGYYNFYAKTALEVIDTDPIDIAIASNQASKIYYVRSYQRSLFVFTKDSQYETTYNNTFSPLTVSLDLVSNYTIDINVPPRVSGNSLYFISRTSDNKAQLREYIKNDDTLVNEGINLTLNRPNLLPHINKMVTNVALGTILMYSEDTKDTLYLFKATTEGQERIQSALYRWTFGFDIEDIFMFNNDLYIAYEGSSNSYLLKLALLPDDTIKEDIVDDVGTIQQYNSYVTLARWYPKLVDLKTPLDNVQLKRCTIFGEGSFDVDIYRYSYNTTITRTYESGSTKDINASIVGRTDDTQITIRNADNQPFVISSLALDGLYKQSSKPLR